MSASDNVIRLIPVSPMGAPAAMAPATETGGGGPEDPMMNERVAKLEVRAEYVDQRLDQMNSKLDRIVERMDALPTVSGLWGMIATVIGVGLAISGLTFVIAEWVKP